jgi:hypothetical protein
MRKLNRFIIMDIIYIILIADVITLALTTL